MSEIKDTQHPKVEIAVENFGPIAKANIDLRPLTVFVGPSNTGKTYFATLVYALYGIFKGFSEFGLLNPLGHGQVIEIMSNLRQSLLEDSTSPKEEIQEVLEKLYTSTRPFRLSDLPEKMRSQLKALIKDSDVFENKLQEELKNCFDLSSISTLIRMVGEEPNEMTISLKVGDENQEHWNIQMKTSESKVTLDKFVNTEMVIVPKGGRLSPAGSFELTFAPSDASEREWILRNQYYLPAARGGIIQSHRIIASSLVRRTTRVGLERFPEVPTMPGAIADFMERIILYEEGKVSNDEVKSLAMMIESDVLNGQIRVEPSPSGYLGFRYLPQDTKEDISLSQVSSMVSELAPLVLFLRGFVCPNDTLIIEEPEAHLHPGAQADMAVILARLVRAGVRVIITTHSDWLLQEIGNLIRVGELEEVGEEVSELPISLQKEDVGVWHFQKSGKVEEIPYDRINGVEPMEYLDVAEDLYNRSARLQNRLEETKGDNERE